MSKDEARSLDEGSADEEDVPDSGARLAAEKEREREVVSQTDRDTQVLRPTDRHTHTDSYRAPTLYVMIIFSVCLQVAH